VRFCGQPQSPCETLSVGERGEGRAKKVRSGGTPEKGPSGSGLVPV
jgi:hypothetical protein